MIQTIHIYSTSLYRSSILEEEFGLVPVKVQPVHAKRWTSCFTCAVGPFVFSLLYMLEYVCVVLDACSIAMLLDILFFYCRLEYCSMLEYLGEQ